MSGTGEHLPPGWIEASLSEISTILMGQSPPSSTYNFDGHGLPFFQGKAEFCSLYPDTKVWCSRPGKIAEADDVLLSVRAPVGPTNLAPSKCCIGRGLAAIRPEPDLKLKYLLYAFRRFAADLDTRGTGTTFKAVSGKVVREFTVPVPPSAEQSRIADLLDELFSDLDAGVAALERVREKLKQYRASILKAAMEGALSAEWRAQHPHTEPATELLKRILAERRRRWEEDQLAKFKAKRQEPPTNWKAKYNEPVPPDTANLPPLPEGWCWVTVDQLGRVSSGQTPAGIPSSSEVAGTVAWFRVGDMNIPGNETFMENGGLYLSEETATCLGVRVLPAGSIIFPKRGGAIATNKKRRLRFAAACDLNLMAVTPETQIDDHLWLFFKELDLANLSNGSNVPQINNPDIVPLRVPLPSADEQSVIVETVEDKISVIDHLEADLDAKLKSAQALRQSILRHAFTGQLLPQDPNDEPASELLKRIAADRAVRARESTAAKRETKVSNRPQTGRRGRPKKATKGND